ncbi:MAG: regulatory protein RecX [Endomicrobiales bacterium]
MKITRIQRQKRHQDRFSIFLDGSYSFSLSEETLLKHHLEEGQSFEPGALQPLIEEEEQRHAMDYAFRLLGIRSRSEKELAERLRLKNFPPQAVDRVFNRLRELGYLNDAQFASDWVRYRTQQGKGPSLIKAELRRKGISGEMIAEAFSGLEVSPEDLAAQVRDIAEKKLKTLQGLPPRTAARRLAGYLVRRGFDLNTISEVLRSLRMEEEAKEGD